MVMPRRITRSRSLTTPRRKADSRRYDFKASRGVNTKETPVTKVIEVADGDEDFLERFDALVRSVRNAAVDPDVPVGLRYESGEERSVLTITVQNLAGQIAKEEREAKADRDKAAHAAMVATREARAKEKRADRKSVV